MRLRSANGEVGRLKATITRLCDQISSLSESDLAQLNEQHRQTISELEAEIASSCGGPVTDKDRIETLERLMRTTSARAEDLRKKVEERKLELVQTKAEVEARTREVEKLAEVIKEREVEIETINCTSAETMKALQQSHDASMAQLKRSHVEATNALSNHDEDTVDNIENAAAEAVNQLEASQEIELSDVHQSRMAVIDRIRSSKPSVVDGLCKSNKQKDAKIVDLESVIEEKDEELRVLWRKVVKWEALGEGDGRRKRSRAG